ncbi:MAG: DUF4124 domain-containing protein [Methylococcaceae bacterium]|nr:DUF4124 domain-containing protein [Methylococcaceae bacterium]
MKLVQLFVAMLATTLFSGSILAGVYKCTDREGNTSYQSAPCTNENNATEIDLQTGGSKNLSIGLKQREVQLELEKQQKAEKQKKIAQQKQQKKEAAEQSAMNQQLIKDNPIQFSPFAIPPYVTGKLQGLAKNYQSRLPEIEKFRRLAAQKALATGGCKRVEADELSIKSTDDLLVFAVDCSSAKTFFYNEKELIE